MGDALEKRELGPLGVLDAIAREALRQRMIAVSEREAGAGDVDEHEVEQVVGGGERLRQLRRRACARVIAEPLEHESEGGLDR
jgi:hypothetical protein